jgi:hypothetical protein
MMGQTEGGREKRRVPRQRLVQVTGAPPMPYDREAPAADRSADRIYTQVNQDYPEDTDICFERGGSVTMVRITPADRPGLFAAAGGMAPGLKELREQAGRLVQRYFEDEVVELGREVKTLVDAAHAAGYKLSAEDHRLTFQRPLAVAEFLSDMQVTQAEVIAGLDDDDQQAEAARDLLALQRVTEMLRGRA